MSVHLHEGKIQMTNDDNTASIEDLISTRQALYRMLANFDEMKPSDRYHMVKLLEMTEPSLEQWKKALG